ncbi:hypothetical protein HOF92_07605, partial [bacterium]|nr:hypothetical protein [bacterium]
ERVQKQLSSGGLIYFGEEVGPPQHVGGNSVSPGLWETPITAIPLQSDTETDFHSFLEIDNVTMSLLEPAFRSEYGKLKDAQKSLSDQNNGYPDPVSRQGTRNIVFRLIQNLRTFQSPRSERSVKLLRRIFSSLHAARSLSKDLSPSTVLSSSEIFPILGTLPYLSWPLESSKGFFTSIQGTSTVSGPNLENLGFARIQPHLAQQTWSSILRSADPSASLSGVGDLTSLEVTLRTLSITSLPYLSVDQSGSLSVTVSGKIVLGIRNGQRIPAQGFLVEAIDAQPANNTASLSAQTDSTGLFQFQLENRLSGDRTYHLKVEVKDSGLSQSSSLSLSFPYSIIGFEGELKLPEFILEPEFQAQASAYSGDLLEIQASNRPPLVSLRSLPGLTSDIVPLSLILTDTESDPVKVKFSFTSGQSLTITTLHPRISLASTDSVQTTFPLSGTFASLPTSAGGAEITLYWFSKQEPGLESLENQSNLRIRFEIEESLRPVVKGAGIQSEFFDLDNIPPTITFDTPLRDTREPQATDFPEVSLERITLTGGASDRSEIQSIFARNTSYSAGPETTFAATNTGDQLSTWKIDQFPVEPDITNTVEFFAVDGFGNQNQDPVTATFRSLDSNPPIIHITTMTVFSTRNVPLISSVDPLIPMSITTSAGTGSIQLSIQTTSNSWSVDVITTRRIFFEGTAADPGGVSRVRFNSEAAEKFGTSDLNVGWNYSLLLPNEDGENQSIRFSAEDKKNNDSNTTNPSEFFKRKRGIDILFRLIDISAPAIILESTSGFVKNSALTVTTDVIQLSGGAADRSQITSFYLCSTLECRPVSTSNSYLMWDVSLPISQSSSNPITGLIEDEFGFRDNFQGANFLTQADLNDISPPSFVVTSVNGIAVTNTLVIDESYAPLGRPTSTTVYTASACNTLSCSLVISGLIQDESGFVLNSDGLSNFDEFNLRMAHLGSTQAEFNPDSYDTGNPTSSIEALIGSTIGDFFANSANTSTISVISTQSLTSSTQILTSLGFQAVLDFQDDGYWPVSLFLQDGSKEIFTQSGRQAPNIRKREIIYVLKDTIPPEIQLISAGTNSISSSSLVRLRGEIRDQLNTIDSLLINDVLITSADWITLNTTSPWNNFVSLPSQTAIEFQTDIILKAGLSQSIRITAADSLGNTTEFNTSLSVFPIFTTSIVPQFPYDDPTNVAFGGANLTSVFVGDAEKSRVEERSFSATLIRTISGNAKSNFYSQVSDFENFDAFFPRGGNTDSQSLVINSVFSDTTTTHKEVVRLFKETAQSFLDQFITREVNPLPTSNYDVFRDSQDSSSSNLISSTSSKVRFTPFQESVVYLFRATSEANSDQLFRYVKSLLNDPALASNPPSAGGTPTSTGVLGPGTNPVEISSQVSALVITQALSRNTDNEVTSSIEWVYLADRGLQRIDKFQFLNDGRLRGLTPIDLSTGEVIIDPTAMEIEPSGAVAYIGSGTDQRIYKLDITATPPSLITSFGGQGYSDGSFLSIDSIRGFQPENEGNFNELYVVDRTSRRISRFTSSGTLSQYFGDNPFTSGGMVAPVLLGLVDDEWLLLDSTLEFVDFRSISSDELNRNVTTTSLSISSLTSALAFEQTPEMKEESLTNLSALTYTTGLSGEIFSSTTRETFFLQGPNKLHHVVESTFQSFIRTNVNDQAFLPAGISTSTIEVFTAGSSPFEQVLDMSLLVDGSSLNLYVLENHSNDKYRVQLLSFTDQAQSDTASTADLS